MKEHPLPRWPRFMVLDWAFVLPFLSAFMRRVGGVPASPHNAARLLEEDELVMVFPEGVKGTGKPFSDRYRLQRFGRGGFVEIALRTGAPIVPVAVVGSEEIYPKLADSPAARAGARRSVRPGDPDLPVARAARADARSRRSGGSSSASRSTSRSTARRPPRTAACVFDISEQVRETIQEQALREPGQAGIGVRRSLVAIALQRDGDGDRGRARVERAAAAEFEAPARPTSSRRRTRTITPARSCAPRGFAIRFEFPDLPLTLSLAATEEGSHHLTWKFSDDTKWKPKLRLQMDSEVANAYLQGKESLAIAIARGRVKASGDARSALIYLPALRLLVSSYRKLVTQEHPHLVLE